MKMVFRILTSLVLFVVGVFLMGRINLYLNIIGIICFISSIVIIMIDSFKVENEEVEE